MHPLAALATGNRILQRNEYLKMAGNIDTNAYHIASGSLRIFLLDNEDEQVIRFGYKDNMVAALDSYLTGKASDLYIQAIKKTTVNIIPKQTIEDFIQVEQNHLLWRSMMEDLVLQQMQREADLLTSSPAERYRRVLARSPQLFQEIPHRHIASYLRMTPETLSRLKKS